jgi:polyhydroxyalkanoate synthesis regulator phasin
MPQPKKPASPARKPAAAKKPSTRGTAKRSASGTAAKNAAARSAATKLNAPAAARKAAATKAKRRPAKPAAAPVPAPDDVAASLGALRERLVSSLTITSDRLQEAVDDAVRRGRMTRKDAEELLGTLVAAGRAQTEAILADVEQLLGRGRATHGDAVLRTVDRARRRVGGSAFPIPGYDELSAAQVTRRLPGLTPAQLRKVRDHERRHAARKSVLNAVERKLA